MIGMRKIAGIMKTGAAARPRVTGIAAEVAEAASAASRNINKLSRKTPVSKAALRRSDNVARGGINSGLRIAGTRPAVVAAQVARDPGAAAGRLGSRVGRSAWSKAQTVGRAAERVATTKHAGKIGLGGLAAVSFVGGINQDRQVSDPLYQMAVGTPNFDQYALGSGVVRAQLAGALKIPTPTGVANAYRANTRNQRYPRVDGSMTFGMYNSRLG